jgi:hypothetical protein
MLDRFTKAKRDMQCPIKRLHKVLGIPVLVSADTHIYIALLHYISKNIAVSACCDNAVEIGNCDCKCSYFVVLLLQTGGIETERY